MKNTTGIGMMHGGVRIGRFSNKCRQPLTSATVRASNGEAVAAVAEGQATVVTTTKRGMSRAVAVRVMAWGVRLGTVNLSGCTGCAQSRAREAQGMAHPLSPNLVGICVEMDADQESVRVHAPNAPNRL
jgi:hypothetical protein